MYNVDYSLGGCRWQDSREIEDGGVDGKWIRIERSSSAITVSIELPTSVRGFMLELPELKVQEMIVRLDRAMMVSAARVRPS